MIPLDLRGAYQGRAKIVESLQTSDYADAKLKGTARRAEWLGTFEQKRRELNPQRIELVTPELSRTLAERVAAAFLRNDDTLRGDPSAAALFLDTLRPIRNATKLVIPGGAPQPVPRRAAPPGDPLDGLSEEMANELAEVNAGLDEHSAMQMAMQRVSTVLPLVKAEVLMVYVRAPVLPFTSCPIKVSMRGSATPADASFERTVCRSEWKSGNFVPSGRFRVVPNHSEKYWPAFALCRGRAGKSWTLPAVRMASLFQAEKLRTR